MNEFKDNGEVLNDNFFHIRFKNNRFGEFAKLEGVKSIKHGTKKKNKLVLEKEDELILTNDADNMTLGLLGTNYHTNNEGLFAIRTFIPYSNIQSISWVEKKKDKK